MFTKNKKERVNFKKNNKSNCIWEKMGSMKTSENWRAYAHPQVEAATHLKTATAMQESTSNVVCSYKY